MSARILVVDDVEVNVRLLEAKLSAEYFNVLTAYDGFAALKLAHEGRPDIILLDVMMPRLDGFEVCRRLKADPETRDIPVVMVTALSETADRVRGLEAGADDFLTKPVNDIALFARVRSLVRLRRTMEEWRHREDIYGRFSSLIEASPAALEWMTGRAEDLLQRLGLAYRVLLMATREMGFVQGRKYDIEVWAPGVERWLEVSSCSNFRDYQARRMAVRYRPEPGAKPELVHTLNGSGLALPRIVAAILETFQNPDGSVTVPEVLRPYLGRAELRPPA